MIGRPFQQRVERESGRSDLRAAPQHPGACPQHTIEALDVLVQIMLNEKAPPNARVAAANTLLDRAYGKAPTFSTSEPTL